MFVKEIVGMKLIELECFMQLVYAQAMLHLLTSLLLGKAATTQHTCNHFVLLFTLM